MPTTQPSRDSVPILLRRHHPVGPVERAGHDLDPGAVDAAIAQRRAAGGAEIALGDGGGAERGRLAAGPGEILVLDVGEGGERRAGRLLAHPAMADADLGRRAPTAQSGRRRIGSRRSERVCRSPSCSLHPPPGFLQHRQRIAAGKDEIADAGGAQRGFLLAGPACQIDMPCAGGLKGLRGGGRVCRIDLVGRAQAGDRRAGRLECGGERCRVGKSLACRSPRCRRSRKSSWQRWRAR